MQVEQEQHELRGVPGPGGGQQGAEVEGEVHQDRAGPDADEHQQRRRGPFVDVVQQPVQHQPEQHEDGRHQDVGDDAEPEERLVTDDVGGGPYGVTRDEHAAAGVQLGPSAQHGEGEIEQSGDPGECPRIRRGPGRHVR
jgi:hypothetical protein